MRASVWNINRFEMRIISHVKESRKSSVLYWGMRRLKGTAPWTKTVVLCYYMCGTIKIPPCSNNSVWNNLEWTTNSMLSSNQSSWHDTMLTELTLLSSPGWWFCPSTARACWESGTPRPWTLSAPPSAINARSTWRSCSVTSPVQGTHAEIVNTFLHHLLYLCQYNIRVFIQ